MAKPRPKTMTEMNAFAAEMENLCRRHGIWLRPGGPGGMIAYGSYGEEGFRIEQSDEIDGVFFLHRTLKEGEMPPVDVADCLRRHMQEAVRIGLFALETWPERRPDVIIEEPDGTLLGVTIAGLEGED